MSRMCCVLRPTHESAPHPARESKGAKDMKYILMMHAGRGPYAIATWPKKDIQAHIAFMIGLSKELSASGELVAAEAWQGRTKPRWYAPERTARRLQTACFRSPRSSSPVTGSLTRRIRSELMRSPPVLRRRPGLAGYR